MSSFCPGYAGLRFAAAPAENQAVAKPSIPRSLLAAGMLSGLHDASDHSPMFIAPVRVSPKVYTQVEAGD